MPLISRNAAIIGFCCALTCIIFSATASSAETIRLPATADIGLSSVDSHEKDERLCSWGLDGHFKLKSIQEMGIIRFDASAARGREVLGARLYLNRSGPDRLRYIRTSTVNNEWEEGTSKQAYGPGNGACFAFPDFASQRPWAWPGSDVSDVIMSSGGSLAAWAECQKKDHGWLELPLTPALIYAMCVHDSDGLAIQEGGDLTFTNNFIKSVQSGSTAPYILVDLGDKLDAKPAKPTITGEPFRDGTVVGGRMRLSIGAAANTFCWRITMNGERLPRWRIPHPAASGPTEFELIDLPAGEPCTLTVIAVSAGGIESEPAELTITASPALPVAPSLGEAKAPAGPGGKIVAGKTFNLWATAGLVKIDPVTGAPMFGETNATAAHPAATTAVWDGNKVSVAGCRGEYVSFQVVIERKGDSPIQLAVVTDDLVGPDGSTIRKSDVELYRTWLSKNENKAWQPAYCVPLPAEGELTVPDPDRKFPEQRVQTVYVDLYVPKNARAGTYTGAIAVSAADAKTLLPITLTVHDFDMPDKLAFWPQLNAYGIPKGTSEIEVYRLAHQHRNVFFRRDYTPSVSGSGKDIKVDWTDYDAKVGPLLSGEAFIENRRSKVPIEALALPFRDYWPTQLTPETYAYQGDFTRKASTNNDEYRKLLKLINDHYQTAPYIGDGLSQEYKDAFVAVQKQFIDHFREKGWNQTEFQCLFMGKNTHRIRYNVNMWWTTDEPYHWDDWLALQFFAKLWTENRGTDNASRWPFRADISRPQWQGTILNGIVDNIYFGTGSNADPASMRRCQDLCRTGNIDLRFYGGANAVDRSNTESLSWIVLSWAKGGNAALPWSAIGGSGSLDVNERKGHGNTLIVPGDRFGVPVVADIRLKSFRDGEQIIEYLTIFAQRYHLTRQQAAAIMLKLVPISAGVDAGAGADNADALHLTNLKDWQIEALKRALATKIVAMP
jgi:hypothetical protein